MKLEVPASAVGLEGRTVDGMAFTLYGGRAAWDKTGRRAPSSGGPPNPVMGLDGFDNLTYSAVNNQIISPGFLYDTVGNQTRAVIDNSGTAQQYRYDCANRLVQVSDAIGNVLATYAYGAGNQRLMSVEGGVTKYFAWAGGDIIAEYDASGANALIWKTSYVYMGGRLLATTSGADETETRFHHPDRLGTRLTTALDGTVVTEQFTMPFGNMQPFTSVYGGENPYQNPTHDNPSKKRFTSYDRSEVTRMDYAVNRFYSPQQGRFTQVDPIGMGAAELANPQSLNLYAYVENDPINSTDSLGLDGPTVVWSWGGPFPTGGKSGGGGGGLKIGPFGLSFSFGGGSFFNFGSLQQSKGKRQAGVSSKTVKGGAKRDVGDTVEVDMLIFTMGTEGPNFGVRTDSPSRMGGTRPFTPHERARIAQNPLQFVRTGMVPKQNEVLRLPDAITFSYQALYSGHTITVDANGYFYATPFDVVPRKPIGPEIYPTPSTSKEAWLDTKSILRLGGSVSLVWLNQFDVPPGPQMNNYFTGPSITGSIAGSGLGVGIIYSPGNGTATSIGLSTPGVGVTGGSAFKVGKSRIRWSR